MYLAFKEILLNKLRYSLILTTIFSLLLWSFYDQFGSRLVRNNRAAIDNVASNRSCAIRLCK